MHAKILWLCVKNWFWSSLLQESWHNKQDRLLKRMAFNKRKHTRQTQRHILSQSAWSYKLRYKLMTERSFLKFVYYLILSNFVWLFLFGKLMDLPNWIWIDIIFKYKSMMAKVRCVYNVHSPDLVKLYEPNSLWIAQVRDNAKVWSRHKNSKMQQSLFNAKCAIF